jgi:hypothetical protein
MKKILSDKEKQEKFLKWLNNQISEPIGSASSWNWAYFEAMEKVYKKAKIIFK